MTATILSVLALSCAISAFSLSKSTDFSACKNGNSIIAQAQTASFSSLIAPSSYEQYLPLSAPSCIAVTESYTAIADEESIYIFDRTANTYHRYRHTAKVTQLQFDNANKLYFLDAETHLHLLNPSSLEKTETGFVCSTFLIQDNDVYFMLASNGSYQIKKVSVYNLTGEPTIIREGLTSAPVLGFFNGELYYTTWNGDESNLRKYNPKTGGYVSCAYFPSEVLSMAIHGNKFSCVLRNGEFCIYDLTQLSNGAHTSDITPIFKTIGDYSSVSAHDGYIYLVDGTNIRQYSLTKNDFTDYEIGASSDSLNRFHSAQEVCLWENTLFIADNGNDRISVYDTERSLFLQPIATDVDFTYLAAYDDTLLAATTDTAILYDLSANNYGNVLTSYATFNGNVQGVASVYGQYYLVTDKNQFLCLSKQGDEWSISATQKTETKYPTSLAADPYGTLYVACDNRLYAYTETEFLSQTALGKEVSNTLPTKIETLRFDYRSNLYALQENTLYVYRLDNDKFVQNATYDMQAAQVYGITPQAASFTLSIHENEVYVLYGNDFLVCRTDLGLPTLKNIEVDDADDRIFTNEPVPFSAVTMQKNALLVEFDFDALQNADYFPYVSYERTKTQVTALRIGQTDVYDLLAVYDEQAKNYRTYLVYRTSCTSLSADAYQTTYPQDEQKTAYLTNSLSLYKLPYMTKLLTLCDMPRGAQITLLGEITKLDRAYYCVSYTDDDGTTHIGYVPQAYVTPTSGNTPPATDPVGDTSSDVDAIGRMIYLLLSFGAICLLVDYLLLRKPKEETDGNNDDLSDRE